MSKGKDFDLIAEKAIEEVKLRNTKAIIEYSKKTRQTVNDISIELKHVQNTVVQQNQKINTFSTFTSKIPTHCNRQHKFKNCMS